MKPPLLPPLLALPTELKLQIFSYLKTERRPSLMILRRTHSSLRGLISREESIAQTSQLNTERMWNAEHDHQYLIPPGCFPCYICNQVLSASHFDDMKKRNGIVDVEGPKGRPLGCARAQDRACDDCWQWLRQFMET